MPLAEVLHYEVVHLAELPVGVARPEVVSPAAKNGSALIPSHHLPMRLLVAGLFVFRGLIGGITASTRTLILCMPMCKRLGNGIEF